MKLLELDAYVTGELADGDAFEEAMFDAPDDPNLGFLDQLARHGARLASHGTFDMGVSRAHLDALVAAGHKIQIIDVGPPTTAWRTVQMSREMDLIATCLPLGRTDLERVDVEIEIVEHRVTKTIKDAFVDRTDGVIYGLCERPLAQLAFGVGPTIARVRHRDGDRAVIAEWHVHAQVA